MKVLITGGAGFIGTNLANYLLGKKWQVTVLDNFSRRGARFNAVYLSKKFRTVNIVSGDVRDFTAMKRHVKMHEVVFHLAGQVAVTFSVKNPREDFESNLLGTFNILEAARLGGHKPIIIESSTNKVYGQIIGRMSRKGKRYVDITHRNGIAESEPLDFYSPYGCSKGASDLYVLDYARIFDLPTVVFRQSCIYGTHQFGIEDQGWVAHFVINAILKKPIAIYGTGLQVRDTLFVDDLIDAYERAVKQMKNKHGEVFNIGGGKKYTLSLLELVDTLEKLLKQKIDLRFEKRRPGDQEVYISNTTKAEKLLGWRPTTDVQTGLSKLIAWVKENKTVIQRLQ